MVTLLFTDVEGSTRLLHELGDRYGEALHEHRRRLRAAFADHEGVEVDTQGDAFFVAFGRASDAVAAAADGRGERLAAQLVRLEPEEFPPERGGVARTRPSASTCLTVSLIAVPGAAAP